LGIGIRSGSDNTVISNNINSAGGGINLQYADGNNIIGNTIINCREWIPASGIMLGSSYGNTIYHNNLIENEPDQAYDTSLNMWDNGYPSGGNYWSNYTGVDLYSGPYQNETGSDGIGDTPYAIDINNQDRYPLMSPWGDVEPPIAKAGSNQSVFQGMTVTFDASRSTDDVAIKNYVWTFTDVTLKTLTGIRPEYTFKNVGDFEVTLNVTDYAGKWDTDKMWVHVAEDTIKPSIGTPFHDPPIPDEWENVTVSVNVTDAESGLRQVILSYSTDEGATWTNVTMSKATGDTYEGEIPGFSAGTNVWYKIIAQDKANNTAVEDNAQAYYIYTVIPEFPTWTSTLLVLVVLALATVTYKRKQLKTPIH